MSDICTKCNLCKYTEYKQCVPKGASEDVYIYIVGEAPGLTEAEQGIPFVGQAGKHLHTILEGLALNENTCRFFNAVRCYPRKSDDDTGFRAPTDEELDACFPNLLEDIFTHSPKVIVTLGATSSRRLLGDKFTRITECRGSIYKAELEYNGETREYTVIPTYHPSYLIRNITNAGLRSDVENDFKLAMDICLNGDEVIKKMEHKDNESSTIVIRNRHEFNEFCKKYIDDYDLIAYDVETNAEEVHNKAFKVIGFSLASSKDVGCYVILDSVDFTMDESDQRMIEKRLRNILSSKNVMVYNCQYEIPATLNWLGITIDNIDDIFIYVKLLTGNTSNSFLGNRGLKEQCVLNLNYKDWSKDLDDFFDCFTSYKDSNISKMREILNKYYEGNELDEIIKKVEDLILNYNKADQLSYAFVPSRLISRYGSIDSSVLFELKDYYHKRMDADNEKLGINLYQGYEYWKMHHKVACILETNGFYWNEKRAKEVEEWCITSMDSSLKALIKSPLSEPYLKKSVYPDFLTYLKDNFITDILGPDILPKRLYKNSINVEVKSEEAKNKLNSMSVYANDKGIYKLETGNIETLAKPFLDNNPDMFSIWYKKFIKRLFSNEEESINYRKLLNPNATSDDFRNFVSDLLIDDSIKYAKFYDSICKLIEEPNFNIEDYSGDDLEFINYVNKLRVSSVDNSKKFDMFLRYISMKNSGFHHYRLKKEANIASNYRLQKLDAAVMNEIYDLYLMNHNDIEDETTWSEQFRWLVNYKRYKKFMKLMSTYINGKVGRRNVYLADKDSYSNGDTITRRENLIGKDCYVPDDKVTIMQTKFSVNTADTGRWQAGVHNLPAGDTIKGIYTSRFKGGCISMPDGSAMEMRSLCAASGDENLREAFRNGLDIHKFFASKIFKTPYEEVTKTQRGLAKNAVFGIVYGSSVKSFADSYMHGNMAEAQQVFDDMFNSFPKIREFIDKAHEEFQKHGVITTLMQRYISLDDPRVDDNTKLRQSQNYKIQSVSEDVAGVIMYRISEHIKKNNMKSKIFCFIHDSIEIDICPQELLEMIDVCKYYFNVFPEKELGILVECDVPIGPNMGAELEVDEFEHNDDYTEGSFVLKGFKDDIELLVNNWVDSGVYKTVELGEYKNEKDIYIPVGDMFLPVKAPVSIHAGKTRTQCERYVHIVI